MTMWARQAHSHPFGAFPRTYTPSGSYNCAGKGGLGHTYKALHPAKFVVPHTLVWQSTLQSPLANSRYLVYFNCTAYSEIKQRMTWNNRSHL